MLFINHVSVLHLLLPAFRQVDILLRRFLGLLDKAMQQVQFAGIHKKENSCCAASRYVGSCFKNAVTQRFTFRWGNRPMILHVSDITAHFNPVLFLQRQEPFSNRHSARRRAIEYGVHDFMPVHPLIVLFVVRMSTEILSWLKGSRGRGVQGSSARAQGVRHKAQGIAGFRIPHSEFQSQLNKLNELSELDERTGSRGPGVERGRGRLRLSISPYT